MSLTEDFELQVEATCEGKRILWNNNVRIYDEKPTRWRASLRQRIRWAQGHWFVCFKNTKRIFRALRDKRIGFGEFLSTFLYVYSLTPFLAMVVQLALSLIVQILTWTQVLPTADTAITFWDWFAVNFPSLLIFLYSFILLFYVADRLDNHVRFNLLSLFKNILSLLLNTVIVATAQIWGLFRFRHQNVWVKTMHQINAPHEGCLYDPLADGGKTNLKAADNSYPI